MDLLSLIGERGLIIFDDENFKVVAEDEWRKLRPYAVDERVSQDPVRDLVALKAVVASLAQDSAFVDLDRLAELPQTAHGAPAEAQPGTVTLGERSVVLREGNNLYVVPEKMWQPVNAAIAGDARVLVNRGALAAAIPKSDTPQGTFCVLVNFVALADSP